MREALAHGCPAGRVLRSALATATQDGIEPDDELRIALAIDEQTRTVHVTTWCRPRTPGGQLVGVERALGHAADQAGRVHAALTDAEGLERPVARWIAPIAVAQAANEAA